MNDYNPKHQVKVAYYDWREFKPARMKQQLCDILAKLGIKSAVKPYTYTMWTDGNLLTSAPGKCIVIGDIGDK
jgi:hypothetical protein